MSLVWVVGVPALAMTLLLATAIVALALATAGFERADQRAEHSALVQGATDDTLQAVLDMETGLRAYLLTGERPLLQPYYAGLRALVDRARDRAELEHGADRKLVRRIEAAGDAYVREYAGPLLARRSMGPLGQADVRRVLYDGKRRVDALRKQIEYLEVAEQRAARAEIDDEANAADRNRTIGIAAVLAALVLLTYLGVVLRRSVLRPLKALRRAAEQLSAGDTSVRVDTSGNREFDAVNAAFADVAQRGQSLVDELEGARVEVLARLARATEYRDDDTHEHTERVGALSARLGELVGLDEETVAMLRLAAPLHDVGKIGIADAILLKPGRLTEDEYREMQRHTTFGSEMLAGSASPILQMAERIALGHHERWDGTGYPLGLVGDATPLCSRIVAVADVFDALTHERPYKSAWSVEATIREIRSQSGRQFDPRIVMALSSLSHPELERAAGLDPRFGLFMARVR